MLQIFVKDIDKDTVVLYAARASRIENQDAIDASVVGMLADPKEVISHEHLCCNYQSTFSSSNFSASMRCWYRAKI